MRRPSHRAFVVLLAMLVITVESAAQVVDFSPAMVFRRPSISDVSVSPSGDWVAARIRHAGAQGIVVQRRGEAIKHAILSSRLREIRSVVWVGPDSLFVPYVFRVRGDRRATVYRLRADEGGAISAEEVDIDRGGRLVSGLPARDGVVLWSTRSGSRSVVYRATIEALAVEHKGLDSIRKEGTHPVEIVAQTRDAVWAWVTDRKGTVRSYVSRSFEAGEVTYAIAWRAGDADEWREVWRSDGDEDPLIPLGVTRDGRGLIVAAYAGRDTRGLHVFDPDAKRLGEVLFVHPEVDVVDAVFDHDTDQIIAVGYRVAGAMRYRYLASYTHEHLSELATRVGEEGLRITSASLDHRHFTMLTTGPDDPGTFYF